MIKLSYVISTILFIYINIDCTRIDYSGSNVQDILLNGQWDFTYTPDLALRTSIYWQDITPEPFYTSVPDPHYKEMNVQPDLHPRKQRTSIDWQDLTPIVPVDSAFDVSIMVPGWWDEQLKPMKNASWWGKARFSKHVSIEESLKENLKGNPAAGNASLPYLLGVGWYRKKIDVPQDWQGRFITLGVDGAIRDCYLYVNGGFVGYHAGGMALTPFEFNISNHIKPGESNGIIIGLSNLDNGSVGSSALHGYHGYSAGIYGDIKLHISGSPSKIKNLFLQPVNNNSEIRWQAELKSLKGTDKPTRLRWYVRNLEGKKIKDGFVKVRPLKAGELYLKEWETSAKGIQLWSTWDPQLHNAEIIWQDSQGATLDKVEQRFGLRKIERSGRKILLNGRPIMLRGVGDLYYFAPHVRPPVDSVDYYRKRIKRLKELGFNMIRFHSWSPPEEYMQAADELGMLVQLELLYWITSKQMIPKLDLKSWRDMVYWYRRHPSTAIYCGGNETFCGQAQISSLEQMYPIAKELDPGCLVMPMEALRGIEYGKDSVPVHMDQTPQQYFPDLIKRVAKVTDVFGQYALGNLSYNHMRANWRNLEKMFEPYNRPMLTHELGLIGCYLDHSLEERYTGSIPPDLYQHYRKKLKAADRYYMAEHYYENSCRTQRINYKYAFEAARKCESLNGYDMIGAWPIHWHRTGYNTGMMNEFFELRPGYTVEEILRYNGESVILLDNEKKHNFWAGEKFTKNAMLSLYGGKDLKGGVLDWKVVDGEKVLLEGQFKGLNAPDGKVTTDLAKIEFNWPNVKKSRKVQLTFHLTGSGYDINNQWDFWIFPEMTPPKIIATADDASLKKLQTRYTSLIPVGSGKKTKLMIVNTLTEQSIRHLASRGDVLLLGAKPFPHRATRFQIGTAGRAYHDYGTVIYEHPVFANLIHEGFCDWQFYSLKEGGKCIVFNDLSIDFNPILEMISSYKDIRLQASIWEGQTESGRLFVASCNFDLNDPASTALLDRITSYVSSEKFKPKTFVSIEEVLIPLLGIKYSEIEIEPTDKANVLQRIKKE